MIAERYKGQQSWQATDGVLLSGQATMTVDVTPVADQPSLVLTGRADTYGATQQRFSTSWESVPSRNRNFTILPDSELEGWRVLTESSPGGQQAFIVWSSGDEMKDATNTNRTVNAATDNGINWLEIGDAMGLGHQTSGIERTVSTRAGVTYNLSFDYAGRLGYGTDFTRIGFYVDGVQIGTYANTSPNSGLAWHEVAFQFSGNGNAQTIQIRTLATASQSNGRGAMIDDITLTEGLPLNTGYQGSSIQLSAIVSALTDGDGSETLALTVGAIPVGATLTDGVHAFTAAAGSATATVTAWNLEHLSITAPAGFTGTFNLLVNATATEAVTSQSAIQSRSLTVTVLPQDVSSPLVVDLNGDGVQTISLADSTGTFDLLNSGEAIHSGWISGDDAFVAIDLNGNGVIDDRNELFGGVIGEGFAKLASFDSNGDGVVDANDARFGELLLWQDINGNHRTDAGELSGLLARGVASLSTRYVLAPEVQNGNWLLEHGTATFADGRSVKLVDTYFRIDTVSGEASVRPQDRGASITVRSELPQQTPSAEVVFAAGAVFNPSAAPSQSAPVIDWSIGYNENNDSNEKRKGRTAKSWLADFLGIGAPKDRGDLADRTGLKVILGSRQSDKS